MIEVCLCPHNVTIDPEIVLDVVFSSGGLFAYEVGSSESTRNVNTRGWTLMRYTDAGTRTLELLIGNHGKTCMV